MKTREEKPWQGHSVSRCFGHQSLADEGLWLYIEGRQIPGHHRGSKEKQTNKLAGFKEDAPLQPPKQVSPSHSQEHVLPHCSMLFSGGSAVGREVTIQETYKDSPHDGDNPISPATFACTAS